VVVVACGLKVKCCDKVKRLKDRCRWNRECADGKDLKVAADETGSVPMEKT
jgi:hypothetical protein